MGCFVCKEKRVIQPGRLDYSTEGREKTPLRPTNFASEFDSLTTLKIKANQLVVNKNINVRDNYLIQDELGSGAYGKVYKVVHKHTQLVRAMKIIRKQQVGSMSKSLMNEINILSQLDHPNIMKIFEFYQDDYNYYIICEFCSGGELYDKITKLRCFNENLAANIMKQLLSAVFYLHINKVVHRDIKPENILVEISKLLDPSSRDQSLYKIELDEKSAFLRNERRKSQMIPHFDQIYKNIGGKAIDNETFEKTAKDDITILKFNKGFDKRKQNEEGQEEISIKLIDFGASNFFDNNKLTLKVGTSYYIAPEVINKKYNEKCDIWSCGVVLYILLSGKPPFKGKDDDEIMVNVRKGKFSFESPEWNNVSQEAKDLITKMLHYNYEERISAEEALKSPWFVKFDKGSRINDEDTKYTENIIKNIRSLHSEQKLQQAAIAFIVRHTTNTNEIQHLKETFQKFDKNKDGRLTYDELYEGLKLTHGEFLGKEELDKTIKLLDQDQNGYIEYEEFLRASVNLNAVMCDKNLRIAFEMFDKNGDQKLSRTEIKEIFGKDTKNFIIDNLLKEVDSLEDGSISFENFKALMLKCLNNK